MNQLGGANLNLVCWVTALPVTDWAQLGLSLAWPMKSMSNAGSSGQVLGQQQPSHDSLAVSQVQCGPSQVA